MVTFHLSNNVVTFKLPTNQIHNSFRGQIKRRAIKKIMNDNSKKVWIEMMMMIVIMVKGKWGYSVVWCSVLYCTVL